ncbi:HNH endonuclease [Pseudomonas abietaniphila]|uniref:HNH nuclease domain-containing protein n=1 Tax=Pseudomonas abietaniphila TaxID=89065 RepID=A0A1G8NH74_9PSED|nr:HNH endonuclease signature motif containing protein [Pseudomonas abietaniphila]SDI79502.1 hypothetical protein SAMN05216605_11781 [Pseudomonas abietaniphila]
MKPARPRSKYKPKARVIPLSSAAWKRLRAQILAEEPLCRWCLARGLYVASTDVDHISNDGDDNRRDNLTGMCHSCHSIKTAQDMGKGTTRGHDLNGLPLDPAHPWNVMKGAPEQCTSERSRGTTLPLSAPDLLS